LPLQGTRDLITGVGWMATALIGHLSGAFVLRKVDVPSAYARYVADSWTGYIDDLFRYGRDAWRYHVPTESRDRRRLRDLCVRTLDFENHFLGRYRDFLLKELRSDDPEARSLAAKTMKRLPYRDGRLDRAEM